MSVADELHKLQQLREAGALSEQEFAVAKARLLNETPERASSADEGLGYFGNRSPTREKDVRIWSMLLHLSILLGHSVLPVAGLIVPVVIWQWKKDDSPEIDEHGKNAVNWIISELIYGLIFGVLCLVLIGIPFLIALYVLGIIFPIIAALKADSGETWRYPMSIRFLK